MERDVVPVGRAVGEQMAGQSGDENDGVDDTRTQHLTVKLHTRHTRPAVRVLCPPDNGCTRGRVWLGSPVVRALDLRLDGREFDSRPPRLYS